jgi:glycosyltransferase involved in cell wall biosynthesis
VRVRVFALRSSRGRAHQPEHEGLVAITTYVGSPLDPASWLALIGWLLRRPHVLLPDVMRLLWASRGSFYAMAGHVGYLPAAARVATLVEEGGFDRVHGAWAHFPGTVAYLVSRLTGVPFSLSAHAGSDLYRTQVFLGEKVRAADFTVACVRGNAEMLQRIAGPQARVQCVYHGVDRVRFDGRGRHRSPDPRLLVVGRLHAAKGFDLAIEALAGLRAHGLRPKLAVVGEGPERARLEQLAVDREVAAQVEWHGAIPQRDLLDFYNRAWLLLMPSRVLPNGRRDGIPNVVVEALASGLPVVGTRAGGIEEAIVHDHNGALVPPNDVGALVRELARLLEQPELLDRLGEVARQSVADTFDAERNFETWFSLLTNGRPTHSAPQPVTIATAGDPS